MNEDELVANLFRINQTKQKLLKDNGFRFTEVSLDDSIRNKVLPSISPNKTIVPQIFVNGVHYSGLDELKKLIENMDK